MSSDILLMFLARIYSLLKDRLFNIYFFPQELHRKGHDISVHSISHNNDPNYWTKGSVEDWTSEMVGHKFILEEFAKIPSREVSGMRAPHLRVGANSQVKTVP